MYDVCSKLWMYLQPIYMKTATEEDWLEKSHEFARNTNFPNCLGAIDGKHIRIKKPDGSGSLFYNYKSFFSIVLMAVVDADYLFTCIDVGAYGSSNDSNVFKKSNFGRRLAANQLHLPQNQRLPGDSGMPMPYIFVADEAFGLSEHILRPYGQRGLSEVKKVFNYRLSRARRMVECTFGILANKWRILHRPLDTKPEFCDLIIKACCILYNYVRKKDGLQFGDMLFTSGLPGVQPGHNVRATHDAETIRDTFAQYFTSPAGSVSWQYSKI